MYERIMVPLDGSNAKVLHAGDMPVLVVRAAGLEKDKGCDSVCR